MDDDFDFHWPRRQAPYLITPNGRKLRCRMTGRVPVIGDLDSWASAVKDSEAEENPQKVRAAAQPVLRSENNSGFY